MKLYNKLEEIKSKGEKVDIIITADTIMSLDDKEVVEKPESKEHAYKILRDLISRESNEVYTSVWIAFVDQKTMEITQIKNVVDCTKIFFEKLDEKTLDMYIESGEPYGKAGGVGIQSLAATFINRIEGDFYSVWGFPLCLFCKTLREMVEE